MSNKGTQILEAAIDLFAEQGFWNTPTSKISRHAGVSTGTLFNYFESKDALIDAVYLQLRQEQTAHLLAGFPYDGDIKTCLEHVWYRYVDWGVSNPVRYGLLRQLKLSDLVSEAAVEQSNVDLGVATEMLAQNHAAGAFGDIPLDYFEPLLLAQLEAAVTYAMQHQLRDMPLTKHLMRSFAVFWRGVAAT